MIFALNSLPIGGYYEMVGTLTKPVLIVDTLQAEIQISGGTLKCLSIGTPKTINFPFVPNGKLMNFRCPITKHIINRL